MHARVLFLSFVVLACSVAARAQETDQNGVAHEWKGTGKGYTVVDFAATWCRPCWEVLPKMQALSESRKDIHFVVVSVDEKVSGRDALVAKLGLKLPVVWDGQKKIVGHFKPEGMPATFVLDPSGAVVYRHVGSGKRDWSELVAFLETIPKGQ